MYLSKGDECSQLFSVIYILSKTEKNVKLNNDEIPAFFLNTSNCVKNIPDELK